MIDYNGEDMEEVSHALNEVLEPSEVVNLITELYFLLETQDRVKVKQQIS